MTIQKAIEILKNERPGCGEKVIYTESERCESNDIEISASEKQIPKKAEYGGGYIDNGFVKYRMAKCPNCDRWHSSREEIFYCSKCGQRLDWSDTD